MSERDQKLVQLVAAEVIKVLRQRKMTPPPEAPPAPEVTPGASPQPRVQVQPPIGICTGDYSKFPELRGRIADSAPQQVPPAPPVQGEAIALTGIITATQLQQAMESASDGVAVLAPDAKLTPLATDLARQNPQKVRRASVGQQASASAPSRWLYWIDGQCPVATQIVNQRSAVLGSLGGAALPQVVRDLAGAIKGRSVAGGILFVPNAARAICYANRCASLRAVVGTCGEAVEQGVTELGANVLVIEYPHHGPRSMSAMVDRMLQQSPNVPPNVQRDLSELHRCD